MKKMFEYLPKGEIFQLLEDENFIFDKVSSKTKHSIYFSCIYRETNSKIIFAIKRPKNNFYYFAFYSESDEDALIQKCRSKQLLIVETIKKTCTSTSAKIHVFEKLYIKGKI